MAPARHSLRFSDAQAPALSGRPFGQAIVASAFRQLEPQT